VSSRHPIRMRTGPASPAGRSEKGNAHVGRRALAVSREVHGRGAHRGGRGHRSRRRRGSRGPRARCSGASADLAIAPRAPRSPRHARSGWGTARRRAAVAFGGGRARCARRGRRRRSAGPLRGPRSLRWAAAPRGNGRRHRGFRLRWQAASSQPRRRWRPWPLRTRVGGAPPAGGRRAHRACGPQDPSALAGLAAHLR
jgi:hypothetical protein